MTIELSRRWFLFGSAAAVATAAIGIKAETPFVPVIEAPTPSLQPYRSRLISSVTLYPFSDNEDNLGLPLHPIRFTFWLGNREPREFNISSQSYLHWVAQEDLGKWILLSSEALRVEIQSEFGLGMAELVCEDKVDDGPRVFLMERHRWPSKGSAEINYLEPDNSLEARLRREEERKKALEKSDEDIAKLVSPWKIPGFR